MELNQSETSGPRLLVIDKDSRKSDEYLAQALSDQDPNIRITGDSRRTIFKEGYYCRLPTTL